MADSKEVSGEKSKLPANVRVLIFLVSLPGFMLLGLLIKRVIEDGVNAELSWFAIVYGAISIILARFVWKGHW